MFLIVASTSATAATFVVKPSVLCRRASETKINSTSFFFFQAEDGIRDADVTGVQTCALPIWFIPDLKRRLIDENLPIPFRLSFISPADDSKFIGVLKRLNQKFNHGRFSGTSC